MNFQTEPAQLIGYITAAASAVIALVVAFGGTLTQDQTAAILGAVAVLAPIIAALITRTKVYSPATMEREATKAYVAGVPPTEPQPEIPPPGEV